MADGLPALLRELSACTLCQDEGLIPEANPIFQIPPSATIGVFSQAPGNLAHHACRAFADPSGDRLRQWMGIDNEAFYHSEKIAIVPMAFCFPGYDGSGTTGRGGDRPPPRRCAEAWRQRLLTQITPSLRLILLVGSYAQNWHLPSIKKMTLTAKVALWKDQFAEGERTGTTMLALPHPSWRNNGWLRKNPWFEAETVPHIQASVRAAMSA